MKKKLIAGIVIVFVMMFSIMGYYKSQNISNMGVRAGVYTSEERALNLTVEVSGRLTEEVVNNKKAASQPINVEMDTGTKRFSWGISRKPGNQIPNADPGAPQLLSKYGGFYLGDTSKKVIYMTFDEGYENGYTPKILDTLRDNQVKGAFFITGPYLKEHSDLVRRMIEEGHTVGNHSIHHYSLPSLGEKDLEEEILGLDRVFHEKFGKHMQLLRPPKGEYSERALALTQKLGYRNVFWSFAYDDWYRDKIRGADYAHDIVMRNLHNGAILLLHAVSKDNANALDRIIKSAREKGYTFGDVNTIK